MENKALPLRFVPSIALVCAAIVAALSFFLPTAPAVIDPAMAHWRTAVAILLFVLFLWSAILFLKGLGVFKTGLRVAYIWLAVGIILFSGSLTQLPLLGLFDLWRTPWATSGGVIAPFVLATVFMYLGVRKFGRLLKIKNALTSFLLVTFLSAGFTALSYVFALNFLQYTLEGAAAYIAAVGWAMSYGFFGWLLARKIGQVIGHYYRRAMRSLSVAFFALVLSALHEYVTTFFMNNGHPYQDYGVYMWPFIIVGVLFVRAACEFVALGAVKEVAEQKTNVLEPDKEDYVSSIISVAGLASRPDEINPILDDLRVVTAHIEPGDSSLTQEQKHNLLDIYYRLEAYFARQDSLRNYDAKEVRRLATPAFRHMLELT